MTAAQWVSYALIAVVAFLLLGFASPRRFQVKAQRRLPAPPDGVWPYLTEPARLPQWFPFITDCEAFPGDGPGAGSRRRVRLDRFGRIGEREEIMSQSEPNRFVAFEHSRERWGGRPAAWKEGRLELRLEPAENGSVLRASYWFEGVGYLGRMLCLLFLRKRHEADLHLALAHLEKRLVEASFPS